MQDAFFFLQVYGPQFPNQLLPPPPPVLLSISFIQLNYNTTFME